jgi:ferredoxin
VRVERFDVVNTPPRPLPQRGLMRLVRDRVVPRPVIVEARCTRCGECVAVCPTEPKSVDWLDPSTARLSSPKSGSGRRPPRHHYRTCIRCYCCQEVCPERAIVIKTPWLGKLLPR